MKIETEELVVGTHWNSRSEFSSGFSKKDARVHIIEGKHAFVHVLVGVVLARPDNEHQGSMIDIRTNHQCSEYFVVHDRH